MIQSYTSSHIFQRSAPPHQASSLQKEFLLDLPKGETLEMISDAHIFIYVHSGAVLVREEINKYRMKAGSFLLINPSKNLTIRGLQDQKPEVVMFKLSFDFQLFEQVYEAGEHGTKDLIPFLSGRLIGGNRVRSEELNHFLAELTAQIASIHKEVTEQINRITSAKLSTRQELYRRLSKAKSHIHGNLHTSLDLDTLSQVACLSKFHFIRLFKEAFGLTPRQYLIGRRLEAASQLLIQSSKSFHDICQEVGLKDSSSFGRLFKRNFGTTPHMYRQMHISP